MAKRFIEPNWMALRILPEFLQRAWFYIWDKADACGVYHYDEDYMKLDLKLSTPITLSALNELPECEILPGGRILIKNFIAVNYGVLKPNYNPHKPAFRDLVKNELRINPSLNQASSKHEEEGIDEEEDKGKEEDKGVKGGKFLVVEMFTAFKEVIKTYPGSVERDFKPLYSIAKFINEQGGAGGSPVQNSAQILQAWKAICLVIKDDNFYCQKSLSTISNHIQEITQNAVHGKKSNNKQPPKPTTDSLKEAHARRYANGG
jgi:hypothetical protein